MTAQPRKRGRTLMKRDYDAKALNQGRIAVCSILRDWIKGQTVAIECGVLQFEAVFMPHMLLDDGRRVLDVARERGALPQIGHENGNVVELKS
jgi:hypothetical protein